MRRGITLLLAFLASTSALAKPDDAGDGQVAAYACGLLGQPLSDVKVRAVASGKTFVMKAPSSDAPQLLTARLPAGQYQLLQSERDKAAAQSQFDVKPGQVTELGALKRFDVGGHRSVLLSFEHPEANQALAAWRPEADGEGRIRWRHMQVPAAVEFDGTDLRLGLIAALLSAYERDVNRPALKKQMAGARQPDALLALARQAAKPTLAELTSAEGERLLIGADFGQLLERLPSGEWRSHDTGTCAALSALWSAPGGRLVGTVSGQIRAEQADGTWRTLRTLPSGDAVVDLDHVGGRWFVIGARVPYTDALDSPVVTAVTLYSGVADDFSDLQPLRQHAKSVAMNPANLFRGQVLGTDYVVNLGWEFGRIDPATLAWQALAPGHGVTHFRADVSSGLVTAFEARGAFSKLSVSADAGKTWKALETPPYTVSDIHLAVPHEGRAARWSHGLWSANIEFLAFDGTRWRKQFELEPAACRRTLKSEDGKQWFCVSSGGSILRAEAQGLKLELAVE